MYDDDHQDDDSRYEPIPGPLAHGPYADMGLEARRLTRLLRASEERRDRERRIAAARAEGFVPAGEWLDAHEPAPRVAGYPDYTAGAERYREQSERYRAGEREGWHEDWRDEAMLSG
jgi:hypothetical protein